MEFPWKSSGNLRVWDWKWSRSCAQLVLLRLFRRCPMAVCSASVAIVFVIYLQENYQKDAVMDTLPPSPVRPTAFFFYYKRFLTY